MNRSEPIPIDDRRARNACLLARSLYAIARRRRTIPNDYRRTVMSVLHISPSVFGPDGITGGGERAAYELARATATMAPTTFLSFGPKRLSRRDGELVVEIYPSAGNLGGQLFDPLSWRFLEQLRKVDVIHCNQYQVAVSQLAILAGAAMGKRTFVTDRGGVGVHFDPHVPVERCLTGMLALSNFSLACFPVDAPARVIGGGATELFLSSGAGPPDVSSVRKRRVLYVGRLMRHKGIDVLIEGLPEGVGLDVVGYGYDEEYVTLLRRLASDRDVRFVSRISDAQLLSAYRGALVTVLPSVYRDALGGSWEMPELLGNVLLESMACQTPVICSDVGGMPEAVAHGATGFVVRPNDPAALRHRIEQLAGEPELRIRLGRQARTRVLDRFTWTRVAERAFAAYSGDGLRRPSKRASRPTAHPGPRHGYSPARCTSAR